MENNQTPDFIDTALIRLRDTIKKLPTKKQSIIAKWIFKWCQYIDFESTFKPERVPRYKRGDVVYVDFGFNVGNEYGGVHYAAVLEVNNHKGNGNIIVIPLTSLDADKTKEDVSANDLYLGSDILPWTQYGTVAKPSQIRAVSKMRIVKPLKKGDNWVRLKDEHLEMIDNRLKQMIFKVQRLQE